MNKKELLEEGKLFFDSLDTNFEFSLKITQDEPIEFTCVGRLYQKAFDSIEKKYKEREYKIKSIDNVDMVAFGAVYRALTELASDIEAGWVYLEE